MRKEDIMKERKDQRQLGSKIIEQLEPEAVGISPENPEGFAPGRKTKKKGEEEDKDCD